MGSGVFGDNLAPRGGRRPATSLESKDGSHILEVVGKQGHDDSDVRSTPTSGKVIELTHGRSGGRGIRRLGRRQS